MKPTKNILLALSLGTALLSLTACNPDIASSNYQAGQVGEAATVIKGVIVSSRLVTVTSNNDVGKYAGGAAGAIAGTAIGGGDRMHLLGAVGGAVLGGALGNIAQDKLGTQKAFEYVIKTRPGNKLVSVTQGIDNQLAVGQHVMVIYGARTRVVPDNG